MHATNHMSAGVYLWRQVKTGSYYNSHWGVTHHAWVCNLNPFFYNTCICLQFTETPIFAVYVFSCACMYSCLLVNCSLNCVYVHWECRLQTKIYKNLLPLKPGKDDISISRYNLISYHDNIITLIYFPALLPPTEGHHPDNQHAHSTFLNE